MDLIKNFLSRYKNLSNHHLNISNQAQVVIKNVAGIDLPVEKISYRNRTIFINSSPLVKGEIFLSKNNLINALNQELGEVLVDDIR